MVTIELHGIGKRFGEFVALHDIDLRIARGELVALLGPSGSGKTTLLRIIAGLEWPDQGDVRFDGEAAMRRGAHERRVGFVFQHYALFRHMRVFDNVAFGLRVRPRRERPQAKEIRRRVEELLRLVQMDRLADRYPAELSGGQRQRVALARALAIEPRVLLLDEPFGALDAKVRQELRRWLRRLHEDTGVTSIFVTHDQEEALELADRVVVMNQGRIEQVGTTAEIYENPVNPFVYQFLGRTIRLSCEARGGLAHHPGLALDGVRAKAGSPIAVYVRPHDIRVRPDPDGRAVVRVVADAGATVRLELVVEGEAEPVEAEMPREQFACLGIGAGTRVELSAVRGKVFAPEAGLAEPELHPA